MTSWKASNIKFVSQSLIFTRDILYSLIFFFLSSWLSFLVYLFLYLFIYFLSSTLTSSIFLSCFTHLSSVLLSFLIFYTFFFCEIPRNKYPRSTNQQMMNIMNNVSSTIGNILSAEANELIRYCPCKKTIKDIILLASSTWQLFLSPIYFAVLKYPVRTHVVRPRPVIYTPSITA